MEGNLDGCNTAIFSSRLLGCLEASTKGNEAYLKAHLIDKMKPDWGIGYWLFPVNTRGTVHVNTVADHWTLLHKLNNTGGWIFYNSMRPRPKGKDHHLRHAMKLVEYVESNVRNLELCSQHFNLAVLTSKRKPIVEGYKVSAQQASDSIDCGVIVCNHMESLIMGGGPISEEYTI